MNEAGDLRLLLASRYPLVIATVDDETRFIHVLGKAAAGLGLLVWTWTATKGLTRDAHPSQYGTTDPARALDFVLRCRPRASSCSPTSTTPSGIRRLCAG